MNPILVASLRVLAGVGLMLVNGVVLIYMLRKVLGHLHLRLGPMNVGWHGTAQTLMDVLKLLTKEDPTPRAVDKVLYFIAPAVVFIPSLAAYAALPFSKTMAMADLATGLLFTFAFLSLVPLGILMAGWSSANKWSLLGGIRAVGQQIAYEVPLLLAALPVVLMTGSLNLNDIVAAQSTVWFFVPAFPALVMFFIAALVELNQTPFDMAEAESELVAGFSSEYASMKFGMLFLAEFSNLFVMAAVIVTLFFGGWSLPFVPAEIQAYIAPLVFVFKSYLVIFCFMWIRGTFPRVRVDQLQHLGWKVLIPANLTWLLITGAGVKVLPMVLEAVGR